MNVTVDRIIRTLMDTNPDTNVFTTNQIRQASVASGSTNGFAHRVIMTNERRSSKGKYDLSELIVPLRKEQPAPVINQTQPEEKDLMAKDSIKVSHKPIIPAVLEEFVPWGNYKDIFKIVKSGIFMPMYIHGLSGNGKTLSIRQAHAKANKPLIVVQIGPETDKDDLIGGFRLINGETVFVEGPVLTAKRTGASLLLDEIDRGNNCLLCLQGILDGDEYFNEKTGEVIKPAPGFQIFATANTKGRGSDDGKFSGANLLDEAFLERFVGSIEQEYPSVAVERKIVINHMESLNAVDTKFAHEIVDWADLIRRTYKDGGIDDIITTRRLCHIVQLYSVFGDKKTAINRAINRFDEDTKLAFLSLFESISVEEETNETNEIEDLDEFLSSVVNGE